MIRPAALLFVLFSIVGAARAEPSAPPVPIDSLIAGVDRVTVTVQDPVYKKAKRFEGYPLATLLRKAWPGVDAWAAEGAELVLTAVDGYAPSMDLARALSGNGVVAVRDLDRPPEDPWEPFAKGASRITPAPYYLVWTGVESDDVHYRWPYKLAQLSVTSFGQRYGGAAPPRTSGERAQRGFRLFVQNCMPCHAVNQIGGHTGPELNVPKNVTEYWAQHHLRAFIAAPESYRLRSKMPSFGHLPESDRNAILSYLGAMKKRKVCGDAPCR